MGLLGFNAHALGVLATRNLHLFLAAPQALEAHIAMLRDVFGPCADELADDIRHAGITSACLPAVAHDASTTSGAEESGQSISCLHKACLAGPIDVMQWSRWRLEQHLHNLVATGLFADGVQARRACMQDSNFLYTRSLRWLLERKAAVLAVGGNADDVRAVCGLTYNMQRVVKALLLWQRARCVCMPQIGVRVTQYRASNAKPRQVVCDGCLKRLVCTCLTCCLVFADRQCLSSTRSASSRRSTQPTTRADSAMAAGQRLASTWPLWMDRLSCKGCESLSKRACERSCACCPPHACQVCLITQRWQPLPM